MSPFNAFPKSQLEIVAPDGRLRCSTQGIVSSSEQITVFDTSIDVEPGDEVRRLLPNAKEGVFQVRDAVYHDKFHAIPAHYNIKVARRGSFPRHTGGHYINVAGDNARVNLNSLDASTNIVDRRSAVSELTVAITNGVADEQERSALLEALDRLVSAEEPDRPSAYQAFIAAAANHMTLLAPFLPALASMV